MVQCGASGFAELSNRARAFAVPATDRPCRRQSADGGSPIFSQGPLAQFAYGKPVALMVCDAAEPSRK